MSKTGRPKKADAPERIACTVGFPPRMVAFLGYQSALEQRPRDAIVQEAIRAYHAKMKKSNPDTPPLD